MNHSWLYWSSRERQDYRRCAKCGAEQDNEGNALWNSYRPRVARDCQPDGSYQPTEVERRRAAQ